MSIVSFQQAIERLELYYPDFQPLLDTATPVELTGRTSYGNLSCRISSSDIIQIIFTVEPPYMRVMDCLSIP